MHLFSIAEWEVACYLFFLHYIFAGAVLRQRQASNCAFACLDSDHKWLLFFFYFFFINAMCDLLTLNVSMLGYKQLF